MPKAIYFITDEQLEQYGMSIAQKIIEGMKGKQSDNLLTVDDICSKFHVNRVTVWRWETEGLLKSKRMGRRKYYQASDISRLLEQ